MGGLVWLSPVSCEPEVYGDTDTHPGGVIDEFVQASAVNTCDLLEGQLAGGEYVKLTTIAPGSTVDEVTLVMVGAGSWTVAIVGP